ncbi:LOG family protein [Omnitrophica bacterium]|nr:LOG family protein [Candidatus Omnitrophota bacterium]
MRPIGEVAFIPADIPETVFLGNAGECFDRRKIDFEVCLFGFRFEEFDGKPCRPKEAKIITVFGSSKVTPEKKEYQAAVELGRLLAAEGYTVCTGGYRGIMEAACKGAKEAGGKTLAITTSQFKGTVNAWIDEEKSFPNWNERLFGLIEAADAYVVCDGGTGTLVELLSVWEMSNQKILNKPVVIYGKTMQQILTQIKAVPEIIFNPCLRFSDTAQDVVNALRGN